MLAHVDDGICAPAAFCLRSSEPAIEGRIVVRWGQVGRVIDRIRIDAISPWWLQCDQGIAKLHSSKQIVALVAPGLLLFNRDNLSGDRREEFLVSLLGRFYAWAMVLRLAPEILHSARRASRKPGVYLPIGRSRKMHGPGRIEWVVVVVSPTAKQILHQFIGCLRQSVDRIPARPHRVQRREQAGRRIEANCTPNLRRLGRRVREYEGGSTIAVQRSPQPGKPTRYTGDARSPVFVRNIQALRAILASLLERNRHGDDAAIELRDRNIDGSIDRVQSSSRAFPRALRHLACNGLNNRDAKPFER